MGKNNFSSSEPAAGPFDGMKVLVMGLGLHGGGVEAARYMVNMGAEVTVTDLRDEKVLAPSIEKLGSLPVRYVLGKHNIEDFSKADMVVKNPGVKIDSPFLRAAKRIETDISLFLSAGLLSSGKVRLIAVTGSKGKSGTSSALHWVLDKERTETAGSIAGKAWLGGNITVSPLSFLDKLKEGDDVVLELSSWQLGDLRGRTILKPRAAILTAIMEDHLNRYVNMEAYVGDKRLIYQNQDEGDVTVAGNDEWGKSFLRETPGRKLIYSADPLPEGISGGWIINSSGPGVARMYQASGITGAPGAIAEVVPEHLLVPGYHQKQNLLAAALALLDLGLKPDFIRECLGHFPGIEHRLEFFHEDGGIRFYNDSAATIPEAAAAAIKAFENPTVLVTGGTDKNLDFGVLARAAAGVKAIILLAGTGSDKLKTLLNDAGVRYEGPFDNLDTAIQTALNAAESGDTVVLSPGCASFGMFLNEFDRGKKWKEGVRRLTQ